MADTELDYQRMVQDALLGVVRRALAEVGEGGMPEGHHFYVSFRTDDPGVLVPRGLRARYPEEITIVLQFQFWDLAVDDEGFSVTLTFDGAKQRIGASWEALTAFVDPEAEFALRFPPRGGEDGAEETAADGAAAAAAADGAEGSPGSADPQDSVVNIDRFRRDKS